MKTWLCIPALLLSAPAQAGDAGTSALAEANRLYMEKEYGKAVALYEELVAQGYEAPELYYNLGNAHYKSGSLAKAILNYERARRLAPDDDDIGFNLALADAQTVDKIEALPRLFYVRWYEEVRTLYTADEWAVRSLMLLFSGLPFFAYGLFRRRPFLYRAAFGLWGASLLTGLLFLALAAGQHKAATAKDEAVILSPSVTVRSSPAGGGADLFMLHEGTRIRIITENKGWYEIRLPDGNVGWIPGGDAEII